LLAVLLGACATVRDARHAQDPATALPGERTPTAAELGIPVQGKLALDLAERTALDVLPSVLAARRAEESAEARVGESEAAFYPQLSASASKEYVNHKAVSGGSPSGREEHRFESAGFQLSWLMFDFGRTSALARQAADQWLAAQADARTADVDAVFGVRAAYFVLIRQLGLLEVAKDAVSQFQEHYDQVSEFVRVGTRIPYDRTKAEVDLGNAKVTLVQTEDSVLLAQANLAGAMGLAEMSDWTPDGATRMPAPPDTFEKCWAVARGSRPALVAATARVEAASELVNARIAELYPQMDLGFGFTAAGSTTPLPWNWRVGPALSWVPFDGFQNLYTIDDAVANMRIARTARAAVEQQTWLDVRTAWIGTIDAKRKIELTALLVRSAEENLTLAQGRFDAGRGTAVELTDARTALTSARSDDVTAHAELDLATALLWKALGATGHETPKPATPNGKKP
jgi:outer membrane protein TolC